MNYEPLWDKARAKPLKLKQQWIVDFLMRNPPLRLGMGIGGLMFEFFAIYACLFGGQTELRILMVVGTKFHLSTIPLMGIFFPYNIPCYAVALLPDTS